LADRWPKLEGTSSHMSRIMKSHLLEDLPLLPAREAESSARLRPFVAFRTGIPRVPAVSVSIGRRLALSSNGGLS
jgi:hypothetical protein